MPDRDIDTLFDNVDKPEEPEEQPEDIAQPELDLAPLTGMDVSLPNQKLILLLAAHFLEMVNIFHF